MIGLLKRAYARVPPNVRGMLWGAVDDLRSVPARFRDPERRRDPLQALHNVGGGDYRLVGEALADQLHAHAGLTDEDWVLDVGCGTGRVALPLAQRLGPRARYIGFDIAAAAVAAARRRLAPLRPDFEFVSLDVRNSAYNPRGVMSEEEACFPCGDAWATLVFGTSVFTHMRRASIARYLAETERVLKPGGRAVYTVYALDDAARARLARGELRMKFKPWEDGAMTLDPVWPETGVAYGAEAFQEMVREAGLETRALLHGAWRGAAAYAGWQDMLVLEKPAARG